MDTLTALISKLAFARGILKIPKFIFLLPAGLLITIIGMVVFSCFVFIMICFYLCNGLIWRFSEKGRIQQLKERYQRLQYKVLAQEKSNRLKFSQRSDKVDMQHLVELTHSEINKRKNHIDHILVIETKRRLNRCSVEMNINNALDIHSTLVETELDLLNETLNQLFQ